MAKTKISVGNWMISAEKFANNLELKVTHNDNSVIYDIFDSPLDDNEFQERFTTEKIERKYSENGEPDNIEIHPDSQLFGQFNIRYSVDGDEHLNLWVTDLNKKDITFNENENEPSNLWTTTLKT